MIYACEKYFGKKFSLRQKKCFLVSVGGAPEYKNQFLGNEVCADLLFKDIGGSFEKHIKISNTDKVSVNKMDKVICELKKLFSVTYMPH